MNLLEYKKIKMYQNECNSMITNKEANNLKSR